MTIPNRLASFTALAVTLGTGATAQASPLPLHVLKDRQFVLDPNVSTNVPTPDPNPDYQLFEVQLPTHMLIPPEVDQWIQLLESLIWQAQQANVDYSNLQSALDAALEGRERLRYLRDLTVDTDARIEMNVLPDRGDVHASVFGWAQVGHENVLEVNAEAAYEGQQYVLRANLHAKGFPPIDIQEFASNPLVRTETDGLWLDHSETLWVAVIPPGIVIIVGVNLHGDVNIDVDPEEARIEINARVELVATIGGVTTVIAADDVHATANAQAVHDQWFGDYACADWSLDHQLAMMGYDLPRETSFSIGDTYCNFDTPIWDPN